MKTLADARDMIEAIDRWSNVGRYQDIEEEFPPLVWEDLREVLVQYEIWRKQHESEARNQVQKQNSKTVLKKT